MQPLSLERQERIMRIFLTLFLTLFLMPAQAQAQGTLRLKGSDIKTIVENRNDRVISRTHQISAMQSRKGFLKRSFLPSLKLYGAHERFQLGNNYTRTQPTYGAELSVNLFNGTKDKLYDDVINKRKDRIGSEKRVTLYQEIIKAKETYWNLIYLDSALKVFNEIQSINSNNLKSVERRMRAGTTTSADRYEFQIKDTEIKRGKDEILMQKKILERELLLILGYDQGVTLALTDKLEHLDRMEDIGQHSEKQHKFLAQPSLIQAEENQISAKIQARSWWPKVDAFVAYNQYNVRNGNVFEAQEGKEAVMGLRASMNLFDFTSGNREAQALKSEAESSKSEANYLTQQIENEAHSEIASLDFFHNQIHEAEENIKRAEGYFKLTLSEYSRGVKNSPDVLGSVDKLFEVKTKYLEILRDFYVTREHLTTKNEI
jgi:outer membrane protein TolC